jgi:hypothetical protein
MKNAASHDGQGHVVDLGSEMIKAGDKSLKFGVCL